MTPPTTPNKGHTIGFRHLAFFALNAYQSPLATSPTVGYEGLPYEGARSLVINNAQPRIIPQPGDDTVEALQVLPPSTAMDADLHVGESNLDIMALLGHVKVDSIGASTRWIPTQTDQRGYEPYVAMLAYSAYNERPTGLAGWRWRFFPYTRAVWLASGSAETPQDEIFKLAPNYTTLTPWGAALTLATNGALTQQSIDGTSIGIPHLISWLADGTVTEFDFDTNHPAYASTAVTCFVNGAPAAGVATTLNFTPTTKPSANDRVVIFYEE